MTSMPYRNLLPASALQNGAGTTVQPFGTEPGAVTSYGGNTPAASVPADIPSTLGSDAEGGTNFGSLAGNTTWQSVLSGIPNGADFAALAPLLQAPNPDAYQINNANTVQNNLGNEAQTAGNYQNTALGQNQAFQNSSAMNTLNQLASGNNQNSLAMANMRAGLNQSNEQLQSQAMSSAGGAGAGNSQRNLLNAQTANAGNLAQAGQQASVAEQQGAANAYNSAANAGNQTQNSALNSFLGQQNSALQGQYGVNAGQTGANEAYEGLLNQYGNQLTNLGTQGIWANAMQGSGVANTIANLATGAAGAVSSLLKNVGTSNNNGSGDGSTAESTNNTGSAQNDPLGTYGSNAGVTGTSGTGAGDTTGSATSGQSENNQNANTGQQTDSGDDSGEATA